MSDLVESETLTTGATASPRRYGLGSGFSAPLANPRRVRAVAWPTRPEVDLRDGSAEQPADEMLDLTEAAS